MKNNYKLQNVVKKNQRLFDKRRQIMQLPSEKTVDALLKSSSPASLIQSFPDEDFFFMMHETGVDDFLPVLSLASSEQWEYIIDVEVWTRDQVNIPALTQWLGHLLDANADRLIYWTLSEKVDFIEYYLKKNIIVRVREHDEDPSDFGDGFFTIDDVFYIKFIDHTLNQVTGQEANYSPPDNSETGNLESDNLETGNLETDDVNNVQLNHEDLENNFENEDVNVENRELKEKVITEYLTRLAQIDHVTYQQVLLEASTVIYSEVEEENYRLRNVRLGEKGFMPFAEAVGIYQPLKPEDLPKTERKLTKLDSSSDEYFLVPSFPAGMIKGNDLFSRTLQIIKDDEVMQQLMAEFAGLCNIIISADQKVIRGKGELKAIVEKACGYLSMGLELLTADNVENIQYATDQDTVGQDTVSQDTVSQDTVSQDTVDQNDAINQHVINQIAVKLVSRYQLGHIFRVGYGLAQKLKWRAEKWYLNSWINDVDLSIKFWGYKGFGVLGGLLIKRPLFFDNYKTGVLYREFNTLEDIKITENNFNEIAAFDNLFQLMELESSDKIDKFTDYSMFILTIWARAVIGLSKSFEPIKIDDYKKFIVKLFAEKKAKSLTHQGSIGLEMKETFLTWLSNKSGVEKFDISQRLGNTLEELFNKIEEECGAVSPNNIESKYINLFLVED